MKQFGKHPVFINYNFFSDEERSASEEKWKKKHEAELAANPKLRRTVEAERKEAIKKYGGYNDHRLQTKLYTGAMQDRFLDEISADKPSPESDTYEKAIHGLLATILATDIGKLLFDSLNKAEKIWIVPTHGEDGKACDCVAATTPGVLSARMGGGVRIYYDPIPGESKDHYYSSEDVLFHELVHGYRASWLKDSKRHRNRKLREYKTEEEFIAVYITNIFRANRGDLNFYKAHSDSTLLSKDSIYWYLVSDDEAFAALDHFVKHDGLAMKVAKWSHPNFNPWRDFSKIEAERKKIRDREAFKAKMIRENKWIDL